VLPRLIQAQGLQVQTLKPESGASTQQQNEAGNTSRGARWVVIFFGIAYLPSGGRPVKRCAFGLLLCLMFACAGYAQGSVQTPTETGVRPLPPNVTRPKLIHSEIPKYPKDAKKAGISGTVVLKAIIAKDGSVKNLEYVSGPEELTDAALKSVKKWKYSPTLLNGEPVEMETTISVSFRIG
jgi:TonB family protein